MAALSYPQAAATTTTTVTAPAPAVAVTTTATTVAAAGSVFPRRGIGEEQLLPSLEPEEIERRLQRTRQELSNRRKILVKNLRTDSGSQVP
eukprot:g12011.t1